METDINIGDKFQKQLAGGKHCDCIIIDIVKRTSTRTGVLLSVEYWAQSDTYGLGNPFEVAKNTVIRNRLNNKTT